LAPDLRRSLRAIWQFMTDRFAWEKTEHGVSRSMTKAAAP